MEPNRQATYGWYGRRLRRRDPRQVSLGLEAGIWSLNSWTVRRCILWSSNGKPRTVGVSMKARHKTMHGINTRIIPVTSRCQSGEWQSRKLRPGHHLISHVAGLWYVGSFESGLIMAIRRFVQPLWKNNFLRSTSAGWSTIAIMNYTSHNLMSTKIDGFRACRQATTYTQYVPRLRHQKQDSWVEFLHKVIMLR